MVSRNELVHFEFLKFGHCMEAYSSVPANDCYEKDLELNFNNILYLVSEMHEIHYIPAQTSSFVSLQCNKRVHVRSQDWL